MNATTPKNAASFMRQLAVIAVSIATFCLTLVIAAGQAYAAEESAPEIPADNPTAQNNEADQVGPTAAPAAGAGALASADAPATTQNDNGAQVTGSTPAEEGEPTASSALQAANDTTYPGDNGSMSAFIGLTPTSSKTCDISNATITRNETTNAVYVDMQCEVGQAIDLAVAVDYVRFGEDVYDARNSSRSVVVRMPQEETDEYTKSYAKDGAVYTWYSTQSPLGQGIYYSDPSTNPALSGGSVSQSANLASYDVNLEDFIDDRGASWRRGKAKVAVRPARTSYSGTLYLPEKHEIGADSSYRYMQSPFYFEEAGQYTFVAQFTYMEEYRSKNTVDENVGYVLYASNPVVYRINVTNKPVVTVHVVAIAEDVGYFDFTNNDTNGGLEKHADFYVDLEKRYYVDPEADNDPYLSPELKQLYYYKYTWCNRNLRGHYEYATPGTYRLSVAHEEGKYKKYVDDDFVISEDDYEQALASQDHTIIKVVELKLAPPVLYTISFYMDDGTTLISSAQYNQGTAAENIDRPANPTKPTTEYYSYEFKEWVATPLNGGQLELGVTLINWLYPVTCDTNYVAVFKETLLKNNAGQKIVYASGGLFSNDALPNGVLGYSLSSQQLSSSQRASVIATHPDTISSERVLGMIQVDLKQHNDDEDRTTTLVTEGEGLNGMHLKFNMQESGIEASDGDELTILQIHKPSTNGPEEIIEHKATVENGEVDLTLDGRLSTFVFLKAASEESGSGESGNDPSGGTTGEGSGEGSTGQPAAGQTEGDSGTTGSGGTPGDGGATGNEGNESGAPSGESSFENEQSQGSTVEPPASEPAGEAGSVTAEEPSRQSADTVGESALETDDGDQAAPVRAMAPAKSEGVLEDEGRAASADDVKASPAPADTVLPATGDPLQAAALALVLMALSALALSFLARRPIP